MTSIILDKNGKAQAPIHMVFKIRGAEACEDRACKARRYSLGVCLLTSSSSSKEKKSKIYSVSYDFMNCYSVCIDLFDVNFLSKSSAFL